MLGVVELKNLTNLCIHSSRMLSKCIGMGLVDVTITQPFVHIWKIAYGMVKLHIIMIF